MPIIRKNKKRLALIPPILVAVFIVLVLFDVRLPDPQVDIPVGLVIWINESSPSVDNVDVRIALHLRCTGTLVAMKKVSLSGFGEILSSDAMNITYIAVGFKTALAYPPANETPSGFPKSNTIHLNHIGNFLLEDTTDIYFPISGDFQAACAVHIGNETKSGTFDLPNVHVEPESELTAERLNRLTFGLSLAFVFFGFIELAYLYIDHMDKQDDKLKPILSEIEKISQKLEKVTQNTDKNPSQNASHSNKTKPKKQKRQTVRN
jgi:hypothetical protein